MQLVRHRKHQRASNAEDKTYQLEPVRNGSCMNGNYEHDDDCLPVHEGVHWCNWITRGVSSDGEHCAKEIEKRSYAACNPLVPIEVKVVPGKDYNGCDLRSKSRKEPIACRKVYGIYVQVLVIILDGNDEECANGRHDKRGNDCHPGRGFFIYHLWCLGYGAIIKRRCREDRRCHELRRHRRRSFIFRVGKRRETDTDCKRYH